MKTTEMFVEQLLIGIAALVAGCLLVMPPSLEKLWQSNFGEVALIAAAAYLLGIFYDRFSDTLVEDTEQHHRLLSGLKAYHASPGGSTTDPFPENQWRARLWFTTDSALEQATYLRSRMRLTRAITTLVPAFGVGGVLFLVDAEPHSRVAASMVVGIVYAGVFLSKLARRRAPEPETVAEKPDGDYSLPKTAELANAHVRAWYTQYIGGYDYIANRPRRLPLEILLRRDSAITTAVVALTLASVGIALMPTSSGNTLPAIAVGLAIPVVTLLFGWTWWRIAETFFTFLAEHDRMASRATTAAN